MKTKLLFLSLLLCCVGCNTTRYTRTSVGGDGITNRVEIVNTRAIWSTESYDAVLTSDGSGKLSAKKSTPDAEFVRAVTELLMSIGVRTIVP